MTICDLHIHSLYSDGKNPIKEMVETAIEQGLDTIGISDHAYEPFDDCCMEKFLVGEYIKEIRGLKEEYNDRINVLCGIEYDYYSEGENNCYDYIIGSVHYIKGKDRVYSVDLSVEETMECIKKEFNGDKYAYAERYFEMVSELPERTGADIIGHFDLLTKFENKGIAFDEKHPRYITACERAVKKLADRCIFEINTGGMTRGYMTRPYPSENILKLVKKYNGRVNFAGDAHDKCSIAANFDVCRTLVEKFELSCSLPHEGKD